MNREQRRSRRVIQFRPDGPLRKWIKSARWTQLMTRRMDMGCPPAAEPPKPIPKSA